MSFIPSPFDGNLPSDHIKCTIPPENSNEFEYDAEPLLSQRRSSSFPTRPTLTSLPSNATLLRENAGADSLTAYLHEARRLTSLAIPLIASAASSFASSLIGIAFVGHLGKFELSSVILALSFFNVTGLSFITGSLGALETLCGQAYGAKNYSAMGIALQRAVLFTTALATAVALVWTQMEHIMLFFGQEPALSAAASHFLKLIVPALYFLSYAECLKRYLMAQNSVLPATVAAVASLFITPLINYALIFTLQWGFFGAAMATNISQGVPMVILFVWTLYREKGLAATSSPQRTWHGWSIESFRGWGGYLRLAAPSAFMVCIEWWTFEACVLMSGWLDDPELHVAVMGLTLNVSGLLYMIPLGIGSATSVRVGNALGAGLDHAARRSSMTALIGTMAVQATAAIFVVYMRFKAGALFTTDEHVVTAAAPIFLIMAWCMQGDGVNATLGGMLRGAGRQEVGAFINLLSFWFLGLPLAGFLAFKIGLGVAGLWTGLAVCASINGIVMIIMFLRIDWEKEAERATGWVHSDDKNDETALLHSDSKTLLPSSSNIGAHHQFHLVSESYSGMEMNTSRQNSSLSQELVQHTRSIT